MNRSIRPDDVNESVLAKGTSEAGISTPVDLHEVVFKKALFNYYNTKYLGHIIIRVAKNV